MVEHHCISGSSQAPIPPAGPGPSACIHVSLHPAPILLQCRALQRGINLPGHCLQPLCAPVFSPLTQGHVEKRHFMRGNYNMCFARESRQSSALWSWSQPAFRWDTLENGSAWQVLASSYPRDNTRVPVASFKVKLIGWGNTFFPG